jgi:hypothetical protein
LRSLLRLRLLGGLLSALLLRRDLRLRLLGSLRLRRDLRFRLLSMLLRLDLGFWRLNVLLRLRRGLRFRLLGARLRLGLCRLCWFGGLRLLFLLLRRGRKGHDCS